MRTLLECAAELGAQGVIAPAIWGTSHYLPLPKQQRTLEENREQLIENLHILGRYAESLHTAVLLEPLNRYQAHYINQIAEALEIIEAVASPGVLLIADLFHMNIEEASPLDSLTQTGKKLAYIRLSDSNRRLPGLGHIDFAAIFRRLKEIGFTGPASVEALPPKKTGRAHRLRYFLAETEKCINDRKVVSGDMPLELIAPQPRVAEFRPYTDGPELQPGQVRIRTLYGSPKHGTELHMYRGTNPFQEKEYDLDWQIFRKTKNHAASFPMGLGNMFVGEVIAVGSQVEHIQIKDRVAGYGPLRETHTLLADDVLPMPENMTWQAALCFDPAQYALQGIRDSQLRLGDTAAVFGLGAIGLLTVAMAKLAGASVVFGVDPIAKRRETAGELGADLVLDPNSVDVGMEIRKATFKRGVDCVIETSGTGHALLLLITLFDRILLTIGGRQRQSIAPA